MKKEVKAVFRLTDSEIQEAFYDFYVRKLKANNIHALFSPNDIKIDISTLDISLTIIDENEID